MKNNYQAGVYLINKPRGRSSFSMVAQMRRLSGIKKVGHAGTLDKEAEGLLIILVGKEFTKQSDKYLKLDKTYEFELKLGYQSTTGDEEGKITKKSNTKPKIVQIKSVIKEFIGRPKQIPPQYSAIKVNGVRSYKKARAGISLDHKPRAIEISRLEVISYKYPLLRLSADVSSGTYIRSLAEDIGTKLTTGAYCTKIVRTQIGRFNLKNAQTLD